MYVCVYMYVCIYIDSASAAGLTAFVVHQIHITLCHRYYIVSLIKLHYIYCFAVVNPYILSSLPDEILNK
uniref:Uncharacterized protein n=1 Tax=Octopus bimaculoides TaxID=37653 RepID=A0A0L8GPE9_OCTBM